MLHRLWLRSAQRHLQRRLAFVVILAGLALVGADGLSAWAARHKAVMSAWGEGADLARSLANQTDGVLQTMDAVLDGVRERVETDGTSPTALARLQRVMAKRAEALPVIDELLVEDAQGRLLASSRQRPAMALSAQDRASFQHHRDDPDRSLFIGWPAQEAGGPWVLTVSKRLDTETGGFAGVAVARLSIVALEKTFAGYDVGRTGVIVLMRGDGTLLARMPSIAGVIGRHITITRPGENASFKTISPIDGTLRLDSTHWFRNRTLMVLVGRSKVELLEPWWTVLALRCAGLVMVLSVLAFLAWRLARSIGEAESSRALLQQSNAHLAHSQALTARANRWLEMAEQIAQVGHWHLSLSADRTLVWSDGVYRIHGVTKGVFIPTLESVMEARHPEDRERAHQAFLRTTETGAFYELVSRILRPDGSLRHVLTRGVLYPGPDGQSPALFGVVVDVTDQKRIETTLVQANARAEAANVALEAANEALEALALQDALTGLANRRRFDTALDHEFRRAQRTQSGLALILIDVDQFKQFNDMYGHQAGDSCLRSIAAIIPGQLNRPGDIAARYGGEELALLLPDTTLAGACAMAERLAQAVRSLGIVHAGSQHGIVTISAGVEAFVPVTDQDVPADLVEHADRALYASKRAGRDRVFSFTETLETTPRRVNQSEQVF